MQPLSPGLLLDRDGIIIRDTGYPSEPAAFAYLAPALAAIRAAQAAGARVAIITNQSGIGRGYFSLARFRRATAALQQRLQQEGLGYIPVYFCPHDPARSRCLCRKPGTLRFQQAVAQLELNTAQCLAVGDKLRDLEPMLALGGNGLLANAEPEMLATARARGVPVLEDFQQLPEQVARFFRETAP